MTDKDLEKNKKEDYLSMMYPELDIPEILKKPAKRPN